MIGKLKSKETRTRYDQKIVRLTIDIPFGQLERSDVNEMDMMEYLDERVGSEMSLIIQALEDDEQASLRERNKVREL